MATLRGFCKDSVEWDLVWGTQKGSLLQGPHRCQVVLFPCKTKTLQSLLAARPLGPLSPLPLILPAHCPIPGRPPGLLPLPTVVSGCSS